MISHCSPSRKPLAMLGRALGKQCSYQICHSFWLEFIWLMFFVLLSRGGNFLKSGFQSSCSTNFFSSSACLISRWALVKDAEVAKKMTKFIELNTIGVSRDSQLRAAKILEVMTNTSRKLGSSESGESFFQISYHLMAERWELLRAAVNNGRMFSLPDFAPGFCHFLQQETQPQPGK